MVHPGPRKVKYEKVELETNRVYAWVQCHPRSVTYLIVFSVVNILLNLADLFI